MRSRFVLVLPALLGAATLAAASPFSDAAARLDGAWRGGDFVLKIDARRAQASTDPARPFDWQHFVVKEVSPDEVVFAVGPELYEAHIDADVLTLTGTSFRGTRVLFRDAMDGLRGTTSE